MDYILGLAIATLVFLVVQTTQKQLLKLAKKNAKQRKVN